MTYSLKLIFLIYTFFQSSGVTVCDDCVRVFNEIKLGHKWQYVIYKLTDDLKRIIVEEKAGLSE